MTDPADSNSIAFALGKIDGQMREFIHKQNNMEMKLDGLVERSLTGPTAAQFETLIKRIDALEAINDRSDGAKGVWAAILQSKAFGTIVTALLSAAAAIVAIKEGIVK